MALTVSVSIIA